MEDWEWDLLNDLIRREEDSEQLQSFRETVTEDDLSDLATLYQASKTWRQKCLVIQVVQDQRAPVLRPLMLDVLQVPEDLGDLASSSRAIALCYLEGDFSPDAFMAWFEEPERAKEAARKWLTGK
jgi:hypothetical protein